MYQVGNLRTLNRKQVTDQASKGELHKTSQRSDKAEVTPIGNVEKNNDLSTKVTVHDKALSGDQKSDKPTYNDILYGRIHTKDCKASGTPIEVVDETQNSRGQWPLDSKWRM